MYPHDQPAAIKHLPKNHARPLGVKRIGDDDDGFQLMFFHGVQHGFGFLIGVARGFFGDQNHIRRNPFQYRQLAEYLAAQARLRRRSRPVR